MNEVEADESLQAVEGEPRMLNLFTLQALIGRENWLDADHVSFRLCEDSYATRL